MRNNKNKRLKCFIVFLGIFIQYVQAQTLSQIQMQNARATGYAIIASRNPGISFSVLVIPWDGVNTLEYNAINQINASWRPQAAIKGNYFNQPFDGENFSVYSSVVLSQAEFDLYKSTGTQWWIVCSVLPSFSNNSFAILNNNKLGIGTSSPVVCFMLMDKFLVVSQHLQEQLQMEQY